MNIIIPIGGIGKRFLDEGYAWPKPLIKSLGKPIIFWTLENLKAKADDTIYIVFREEFNSFHFQDILKNKFRNYNLKFIPIKNDTRGASETLLYALNAMSKTDLGKLTIAVDSDNFFKDDILETSKAINNNLIFYTKDYDPNPIYSYIQLNGEKVIDIKEKIKISDNACVGAYCFKSGFVLKETIESVLLGDKKQKGEYYVSSLYQALIDSGKEVLASEVKNFTCLGTPHQVQSFSSNFNTTDEKHRFCFDLDNTLVSYPEVEGDYSTVRSIQKNIDFLNFLHDQGHTIIIYSARRMRTHNGDVKAVRADIEKVTLDTLKEFNVKYDEIYFGKPYAHFYIDDLAIRPFDDVEKETGFYNIHPETRKHNKIETHKNHIIKYSESIVGEEHFYKNAPQHIKHLFPKLLESGEGYIKLEKIQGVPISFLNINKVLTENILADLLDSIEFIHGSATSTGEDVNIYSNYNSKLKKRLELHDFSQYDNFENIKNNIIQYLEKYEKEKRGVAGVIHGDPVLTNILIDSKNNLKFIDMRGKLGDQLTIFGDIFYDYAKLYQSIIGYDFILMGKELDINYINKNIKVFEKYIESKFGKHKIKDLKQITASLIISLIPLHNDEKCKKYFDLINLFLS